MIPTRPRPRSASVLALVSLVSGIALTACSTGSSASGASQPGAAAPRPAPPVIAISPTNGEGSVKLNAPVRVSSLDGTLDSVVLHSAADPTPLIGEMAADRASWTSNAFFDPGTSYVVDAVARGRNGLSSTSHSGFTTESTAGRLTASTQPADGSTVGVGMPVILRFNSPIPPERQGAVVQRITVQAQPPTVGAWHWFAPTEVHWRPKDYWQPGTKVTVKAQR